MPRRNLLIIDPDPRSLRVLEVSLRKAGYTVSACAGQQTAFDLMDVSHPDLIIAETQLSPTETGFDFLETVREREEWKEIPFMFLSSDLSLESKVKGLQYDVEDYLTKPIYLKEIIARINLILERKERERLEVRAPSSRAHFAGALSDMSVIDLLQTVEHGRKSGVLSLRKDGQSGAIFFKEGLVIDAEQGEHKGEDAVYKLMVWNSGEFEIEFRSIRRRERINMPIQSLLLEGMRRVDEVSRMEEQLPPLESVMEVDHKVLLERLGDLPDDINSVLRLFDGKRAISQVIALSKNDELQAMDAVAKLYFEGLICHVDGQVQEPMFADNMFNAQELTTEQTVVSPLPLNEASNTLPPPTLSSAPVSQSVFPAGSDAVIKERSDLSQSEQPKPRDSVVASLQPKTTRERSNTGEYEDSATEQGKVPAQAESPAGAPTATSPWLPDPEFVKSRKMSTEGMPAVGPVQSKLNRRSLSDTQSVHIKEPTGQPVIASKNPNKNSRTNTKQGVALQSPTPRRLPIPTPANFPMPSGLADPVEGKPIAQIQTQQISRPRATPMGVPIVEHTPENLQNSVVRVPKQIQEADAKRASANVDYISQIPEANVAKANSVPAPASVEAVEEAFFSEGVSRSMSSPSMHDSYLSASPATKKRKKNIAQFLVAVLAVVILGVVGLGIWQRFGGALGGKMKNPVAAKDSKSSEKPSEKNVEKVVESPPPESVVEAETPNTEPLEQAGITPEQYREYKQLVGRGAKLYRRRKRKEARKVFEKALEANPDGSEALSWLAYMTYSRRHYQDAIDLAARSVTLDPTNAQGWLILGAARQEKGDRSGAREAYLQCVEQGEGPEVADCRIMGR